MRVRTDRASNSGTRPVAPWIDLRSDASTLPTAEMRRAMAEAAVGNDDFSEDPTVGELEATVAGLLGKEAAVFVSTGTMGNLAAVLAQVEPGEPILISPSFHIFDHEREAMLGVTRCTFRLLSDETCDGETRVCLPSGAAGRLLALEDTVNRLGGTLLSPEHLADLAAWAHERSIPVHLDGARLFNAACALGLPEAELARHADTVMIVFTKALAAPAGAALAGPGDVIERARRARWMLGGNWKQGGVVAAACLTALATMRARIPEDHARARRLAEELKRLDGVDVDLTRVVTNIVLMRLEESLDPAAFTASIERGGARIGRFKQGGVCRLVTHKDIDDRAVERFVDLAAEAMGATRGAGN